MQQRSKSTCCSAQIGPHFELRTPEAGEPKPPTDDAKPKRSRLRRACLNCRRTHVACNEYRPCHECQVRNIQCTDVESTRPSRPEPEASPSQAGAFPRFAAAGAAYAPSSITRSSSAPLSNHPYPRPPRGVTMAELKAQARAHGPHGPPLHSIQHSVSADMRGPPMQIPSSRTYVFIPRPAGSPFAAGAVPRTGSPGYEVSISENVGIDPSAPYPSPPRTPVWVEAADEGQRTRYMFHPLEGQPTMHPLQQPSPQQQAFIPHALPLPLHHQVAQPPAVSMPMQISPLSPPVHWPHDSPEPVFTSSPYHSAMPMDTMDYQPPGQ